MPVASQVLDIYACDEAERELARRSLVDFIRYVGTDTGPYIDNPFGTMLADACQEFIEACVAKESPRFMVFAPPQHGKSLTVSRQLPAWALGRWPSLRFVGASYGDVLAKSMSRDVMRIMEGDEYRDLFPGTEIATKGQADGKKRSDEFWELNNGPGSYRARGVGQGLSGFPAQPLVIDDPFKDRRDANSAAVRRDVWDWYAAVGRLRVQPGSGIMLMHTRWNMDDLAGRLIEQMKSGEGEEWRVIKFPAIATHDEEFRKEGEALCPHRYDLKALRTIEPIIGPYVWSALYQQEPQVEGGSVFLDEWWQYYEVLPRIKYRRIYADTAQKTKERNDYSVFQCWGMGVDNRIYLLDQIRGKWEAPELEVQAIAFWAKWNVNGKDHEHTQVMKIEDKSSGTGLIQGIRRKGGIPIEGIPRNIDKSIRADDGAPQIAAGNVVLPENAVFLSDYLSEFSAFTKDMSHAYDDQIDPTLDAISDMLGGGGDIYAGAIT